MAYLSGAAPRKIGIRKWARSRLRIVIESFGRSPAAYGRRAGSVVAALLLAFAGLSGVAKLAQADVLVSTIGQSGNTTTATKLYLNVQGFTTGGEITGYSLTSIEIQFNTQGENSAAPDVTLRKDSPTSAVLATLSPPATFGGGNRTFTAPSGTVLDPSSTYYIAVVGGVSTLNMTNSDDEDEAGENDWSVDDDRLRRLSTSDGDFSTREAVLRMRINGTVVPPDNTAPALDANTAPAVNGRSLVLTYDEPLDTGSTPSRRAFGVKVGGSVRTITGVAVRSKTVTLILSPWVTEGQTVTVSYTVPATRLLQDPSGNAAGAFTDQAVTNNTPLGVTAVAVTSRPGTATDTYRLGETIKFTVTFSRAVEASTDRPHLEFLLGETVRQAVYESGSATAGLVFAYTVAASDSDDDGVWIGNRAVRLDSGEYVRGVDPMDAAMLTHATIGTQHRHKVNGSLMLPTATADATLKGLSVERSAGSGKISSPRFREDAERHVIKVGPDVTRVAVTPQTRAAAATVAYLDESDGTATDADTMTDVFDMNLTTGRNVFKVKVTATDAATTKTYTFIVVRHSHWPREDPAAVLTTNFIAGDGGGRVPAMGAAHGIGPSMGVFTRTFFEIAGARYRLVAVLLVDQAFTGSRTTFSADTVAACFPLYAKPPDALAKKLRLRIGSRDFDFAEAARLAGPNGCYEWARPAGLSWKIGELVSAKLFLANSPATGRPVIVRAAGGGGLLARKGTIADADGLTRADAAVDEYAYSYQWIRVEGQTEEDIAGANAAEYAVAAADIGTRVKVRTSFRDDLGHEETRTSEAFSVTNSVAPPSHAAIADIWSATLTPADLGSGAAGCSNSQPAGMRCNESAVLTDDTVTLDSVDYGIRWISAIPGRLRFAFSGSPGDRVDDLTLLVGGTPFAFSHAVKEGSDFEWPTTTTLTAGTPVALRITRPALGATLTKYDTVERANGDVYYRFDLKLSERVLLFPRDMRAHGFDVTNGAVFRADRIDSRRKLIDGSWRAFSNHWRLYVRPTTMGTAVSVSLPRRECSVQGAVCAPDGRRIESQTLDLGTPTRLSVSIADASGSEADGRIDLPVTLSRASDFVVRVKFRTTTGGTATPSTAEEGADYYHYSSSMEFRPGETSRGALVAIWRDGVDNEPAETVMVEITEAKATHPEFATPRDVTITDATATATITSLGQSAPPSDGLQAEFRSLPARHDGSAAFTFEIAFLDHFEVTSQALRDSTLVANGTATAVEKVDAGNSLNWRITVEPDGDEEVTVILLATADCDAAGAICTADDRMFSSRVSARVPGPEPDPATRVTSAAVTSNPGDNGVWDDSETVEAEVRFSEQVSVHGPPGVGPVLTILLDGERRTAAYASGTGTDTLSFSHTVTAADDGARKARVAANGLDANGVIIGDSRGRMAELGFFVAPWVTGVELAADASGDGVWSADETIEARLTFSEAVTVADGTPTVGVIIGGEAGTLAYASGSGGDTLVFSRAVAEDEGNLSAVAVTKDGLALTGATLVSAASGLAAELAHDGTEPTAAPATGESKALTAEFRDLPDGHGAAPFTFELRFHEEFHVSYVTLRDSAFTVTNGRVTNAGRLEQGKSKRWGITVKPQGGGDVTVTLPATTDCAAPGAICAADNRRLAAPVSATVPETAPAERPFRVLFSAVPKTHDGTSPVVFKVDFTKRPKAAYSYVTMRDRTLQIRQGGETLTATRAARLNRPHNDRWQVAVTPGSKENLNVSIGPFTACAEAGAVCTTDDEVLSNEVSRMIVGPPGFSVADARAKEAAHATVDFAVSLSRPWRQPVTVAYATSDGAATAGHDYTATSGTLTFARAETVKTVSVPVLQDAHDEGEETFTLTLSNPQGGDAWLKDATATGTIENTDPMPEAWLARFGRTVADQVLDAVSARLEGGSAAFTQLTLGGSRVVPGAPRPGEEEAASVPRLSADAFAPPLGREGYSLHGSADPGRASVSPLGRTRALSMSELLLGSSFLLASAEGKGGASGWSLWGRGARSSFSGRDGELTLDGDVSTGLLGTDYESGRMLAGATLAWSTGDGSYSSAESRGEVESTLASVYPYLRYAVGERLSAWGVLGLGKGELTLVTQGGDTMETDLSLGMAAAGVKGALLTGAGFGLEFKADALIVRTESDKTTGLASAEAETRRLRLALEGSREVALGGGALTPSLEVGLRYDGGDAETGAGVEAGGGLRYAASGLTAEFRARGLLAHEETGYEEWGVSGSVAYSPGKGGRGLSIRAGSSWGAAASGAGRIWSDRTAGLARSGDFEPGAGHEAEVGYGLDVMGRLLTHYSGLTLHQGGGRTHRLGARWQLAPAFDVSVEASRKESASRGKPESGVFLRGSRRW